jgi:hypothetical protein
VTVVCPLTTHGKEPDPAPSRSSTSPVASRSPLISTGMSRAEVRPTSPSSGIVTWGNGLCGSVRADRDLVGLRGPVGRCSGLCGALAVLCLDTAPHCIPGVVIMSLTIMPGAPRPSPRVAVADSPGMSLQAARQSTGGRG